MTAPAKPARPAAPVPPGLAAILAPLDAIPDTTQLSAVDVAEILGVTPKTVVYWATSRQLSGELLSRKKGWRFTPPDLREFRTKRYQAAR
jgi:hypothetical protein